MEDKGRGFLLMNMRKVLGHVEILNEKVYRES